MNRGAGGRVLHVFQQFPGIFNLGARGGVNLVQIEKAALADFDAGAAFAAGFWANAALAVEAFGQNPGQGGFAGSPRAGEQVGVMQALLVERVGQGLEDVLLSGDLAKIAGPPFSGEYLVAHACP